MFFNIDQNEPEWFKLKAGKVSGSKIGTVMAHYGKSLGEPAKRYALKIALEQLTGNYIHDEFKNNHMKRGSEQEPAARKLYEDHFFCDVSNGGFFDNGKTGCSPDGLVGKPGVIEIKSIIFPAQFLAIERQKYDGKYRWQLAFNLKETKREWIDYVSYCSDFPEDRQLFIQRLTTDDFKEEFENIDIRLEEFFKLVKTNKEMILNQ